MTFVIFGLEDTHLFTLIKASILSKIKIMKIEIASSKTIKEIQDEFSHEFPYLALHFFGLRSVATDLFSKENKIENANQTLGELYVLEHAGAIEVHGDVKVDTLENQFLDEFNISVQLYRKSGNLWLQTIETNHWTLSEQNLEGEEMDRNVEKPKEDFDQFREQL